MRVKYACKILNTKYACKILNTKYAVYGIPNPCDK